MKTLSSSQPFFQLSRMSVMALGVFAVVAIAVPVTSFAQAPANVGTRVAVIDISFIFKNHQGFKTSMNAMKSDVQAFESQLKAAGDQIKQLQGQLAQYKAGSTDYKNIEAQMVKNQFGTGQPAAALKKRDFLQREAEIYFDTYNQVVAEVAKICEQYGIGLVVRFNSEPITKERSAILEGVNRAVVYQKNLNITELVLKRLGSAPAAATAKLPAATRPQ